MTSANPFSGYQILITGNAKRTLKRLDKPERIRIIEKIEMIVIAFHLLDVKKLKNCENLFRVRVGDFRVIYRPEQAKKEVVVCIVGHRREVYKLLKSLPRSID